MNPVLSTMSILAATPWYIASGFKPSLTIMNFLSRGSMPNLSRKNGTSILPAARLKQSRCHHFPPRRFSHACFVPGVNRRRIGCHILSHHADGTVKRQWRIIGTAHFAADREMDRVANTSLRRQACSRKAHRGFSAGDIRSSKRRANMRAWQRYNRIRNGPLCSIVASRSALPCQCTA